MKILEFCFVVSALITITTTKSLTTSSLPEGRIIGGENVTIEQVPYQILLNLNGSPWCGGTIINESVILTAAHCSKGINAKSFSIQAGSTFLDTHGGDNVHNVSKVYVHEGFSMSTLDYDVALLVLETPLRFTNKIQPLSLPDENEFLEENEIVVISGWGNIKEGGYAATVLQAIKIPVINQPVCQKLYSNFMEVTPRMLCAGYIEGGKDHCHGDSGGPVVSNGKIHGIVSWANGCARPNYPGVNTRVTAVRQWIRSKVGI